MANDSESIDTSSSDEVVFVCKNMCGALLQSEATEFQNHTNSQNTCVFINK